MWALVQRAFNMLWANLILVTGMICLCQRLMWAFHSGYESATYTFCGPTHCSRMTENCAAYGPMWLNGPNIMVNKMGPYMQLHKLASGLLWAYLNLSAGEVHWHQRPTQAFRFGCQSTTYKFCEPTCHSCMTENCTAHGPMWLNRSNIIANKMGPYMWLCKLASRLLRAHLNLLAGEVYLHQRPTQAFCFSHQSTTYKFCGPTRSSCMIENCTAHGPMWLNGSNIMANKMGPYRWLCKLASRLLWAHSNVLAGAAHLHQRPMWVFRFSHQSTTYRFCSPMHCFYMTEDYITYGPI
jgi:hypothetical protein